MTLRRKGLSKYIPDERRTFIASSKRSLKCIFLNNDKTYGSIPTAHFSSMKEELETISLKN